MQRLYYKYFISPDNTYAGYVDFTFTGLYLDCLTKSHMTRIILFLSEFNTARWNESVTGSEWPGPKKMAKNSTILSNFTCHFKVINSFTCTYSLEYHPILFPHF